MEESRLKRAGFQPDAPADFSTYAGSKSKDSIERLEAYTALLAKKEPAVVASWLYLYGPNGTQKTTVAQTIGRRAIHAGLSAHFILMKSLIDLLWESQRNEDAKKQLTALAECDVLIIDEAFSKDKVHLWASGNQIGYIDEFLRERVLSKKGCVFISNTKPEEIEAQGFSHSIQDLVCREVGKQNALLEMKDVYFDSINRDQMPTRLF